MKTILVESALFHKDTRTDKQTWCGRANSLFS